MTNFEVPELAQVASGGRMVRLHYEDSHTMRSPGADSSERPSPSSDTLAVVFLHILALDSRMWEHQVNALVAKDHRCVTLDFRGQGRSSAPRHGYGPDRLAEDVTALLDHRQIRRAHFVGASMGGFVALRIARAQPSRVASLTLIGTTARREAPADIVTNFALANILRLAGPKPLVRPILRSAFGPEFLADSTRADERAIWADHFARLSRLGTARAVRAVTHRSAVTSLDLIDIPTQVLVGEHDTPRRKAAAAELAAAMPNARGQVVPRSGHCIPVEQPDIVTTAIQALLNTP